MTLRLFYTRSGKRWTLVKTKVNKFITNNQTTNQDLIALINFHNVLKRIIALMNFLEMLGTGFILKVYGMEFVDPV